MSAGKVVMHIITLPVFLLATIFIFMITLSKKTFLYQVFFAVNCHSITEAYGIFLLGKKSHFEQQNVHTKL